MDFSGIWSVDTVHRCTPSYLLAVPPCLWCLVKLWHYSSIISIKYFHWWSRSCMIKSWHNKVIYKVRKRRHRIEEPPVWSRRGWDFRKQGRKVHWALRGHETQFSSTFDAKLSLPYHSFPERLQPITAPAMCTVTLNVLAPPAFNPESLYFIPLFNKISLLCRQQPGGGEASNEGCNSSPRGHDFTDNSNILRAFVTSLHFLMPPWCSWSHSQHPQYGLVVFPRTHTRSSGIRSQVTDLM